MNPKSPPSQGTFGRPRSMPLFRMSAPNALEDRKSLNSRFIRFVSCPLCSRKSLRGGPLRPLAHAHSWRMSFWKSRWCSSPPLDLPAPPCSPEALAFAPSCACGVHVQVRRQTSVQPRSTWGRPAPAPAPSECLPWAARISVGKPAKPICPALRLLLRAAAMLSLEVRGS